MVEYNPETGEFTKYGEPIGYIGNHGYLVIRDKGQRYLAHRYAFYFMTGTWPKKTVDHINRIKIDNRWSNLRDTSYSNQNKNRGAYGTSGVKYVYPNRYGWMVKVKDKYYGTYSDKELAELVATHAMLD